MTRLILLRHGPTAWSREHRLQGRSNLPLDEAGRETVRGWRWPSDVGRSFWFTSPLERCIDTAVVLGLDVTVVPELVEMDWGRWEGRTIAELRADPASESDAMEARGLDLLPPGGESPRMVQERLKPFLREIGGWGVRTGAITHKGVIRALLALATGWDMREPEPVKLAWDALHVFQVEPDGTLRLEQLNRSLTK
ncbi:MAG TPA: histidine phosphatase family protein [Stellaceae bacterium]|nr:histidine phosphatase family protein [Stellaceae bacterium]